MIAAFVSEDQLLFIGCIQNKIFGWMRLWI